MKTVAGKNAATFLALGKKRPRLQVVWRLQGLGVRRATAPARKPARRNAHLPSVWFAAMSTFTLALLLATALTAGATAPGTAGSTTSTACGSGTSCSANSSSYIARSLTYTPSTGLFAGTLTTNGATAHHAQLLQEAAAVVPALRNAGSILTHEFQPLRHLAPPGCPSTVTSFGQASPSCIQQTFPATSYSFPAAAPITGLVGYSLSGMNIYNPLEAGFSSTNGPSICSTSGYYCSMRLQNLCRACSRRLLTSLGVHVHFSGWS